MARFFERRTGPLFCLFRITPQRLMLGVRFQPNRDYVSNDNIQTPRTLARQLVDYFAPTSRILEPCAGDGHILDCLPNGATWCEIKRDRDFFAWRESVDWILTNPPWSQIRPFLAHAFKVSANAVFLMTVNHAWTKARLREMKSAGFGLCEILLIPTPDSFPPTGCQLGAIHYQRGYQGPIKLSELAESWPPVADDGCNSRSASDPTRGRVVGR